MADQIHSTGRGGHGNIGPDAGVYADGGIVREGVQGESLEGDYSTGRGGAGNIPNVGPPQAEARRRSTDIVPEVNQRLPQEDYHVGRGGAGNVHKDKHGGHTHAPDAPGFTDKVKHALHLDGKKHANESTN